MSIGLFHRVTHWKSLIAGSLKLNRTRRQSVCQLNREEGRIYRKTSSLALKNLLGAMRAYKLLPRDILEYIKSTGLAAYPLFRGILPTAREFAVEIKDPPKEKSGNPLKNVREAASYLIRSPRIRQLQGRILKFVWQDWFSLELTDNQALALGAYSNTAWLSRGLLKASGVSMRADLSGEDKARLGVVLEPYTRTMDLRRRHLEGLSSPGRALLSALLQKKRIRNLKRSGFAPEDLKLLYPDIIDYETLRARREAVVSLKKEYIRNLRVRDEGRRFGNYMHLQTLIMGAPGRGPVRIGRFMAAVERRQA